MKVSRKQWIGGYNTKKPYESAKRFDGDVGVKDEKQFQQHDKKRESDSSHIGLS